jgi:hypothetical protein
MQSKGSCAYCGRVLTRSGMAKHLRSCERLHLEIAAYGELMPVVNSPRTGVCGYTGPAEPPW